VDCMHVNIADDANFGTCADCGAKNVRRALAPMGVRIATDADGDKTCGNCDAFSVKVPSDDVDAGKCFGWAEQGTCWVDSTMVCDRWSLEKLYDDDGKRIQ